MRFSPCIDIQEAAAKALASLLSQLENNISSMIVKNLLHIYQEKLTLSKPILDEFGHVVEEGRDQWESRCGVALALEQLASLVTSEMVTTLINFYVTTRLRDRNEEVQRSMLSAGVTLVSLPGKEHVSKLLPIFEKFLKKTPASGDFDAARSGVIVLMGTLARHLDNDDPKLKPIVNKSIEALSKPSQQLQKSVVESFHPLIVKMKDEVPAILKKLMNRLLNGGLHMMTEKVPLMGLQQW